MLVRAVSGSSGGGGITPTIMTSVSIGTSLTDIGVKASDVTMLYAFQGVGQAESVAAVFENGQIVQNLYYYNRVSMSVLANGNIGMSATYGATLTIVYV